jgi:hypothetical protein
MRQTTRIEPRECHFGGLTGEKLFSETIPYQKFHRAFYMQIGNIAQLLNGGRKPKNSKADLYRIGVNESNGDFTSASEITLSKVSPENEIAILMQRPGACKLSECAAAERFDSFKVYIKNL